MHTPPPRRALRPLRAALVAAACLAVGVTCEPPTAPKYEPVASRLIRKDGVDQTDTVGQALPRELRVLVLDQRGKPMPNAHVAWGVASGGGRAEPATSVSDETGTVRTVWTLGTKAGEAQRINVTVPNAPADTFFVATAVADRPRTMKVFRAGTPPAEVTGPINLDAKSETVTLTATPYDQYDNVVPASASMPIEWSTSDTRVATAVNGVLTALDRGAVTLTVKADTVQRTVSVVVEPTPAKFQITSQRRAVINALGFTSQINWVVQDKNSNPVTTATTTFTSRNDAVATVTQDGRVTSIRPDTVYIVLTSGGAKDSVHVTSQQVPATIAIVSPPASIERDAVQQLQADVRDTNNKTILPATIPVQWQSSAPAIASVGAATGSLRGLATGQATITATVTWLTRSWQATTGVQVIPRVGRIAITGTNPDSVHLKALTDVFPFSAQAFEDNPPTNALISNASFSWRILNPAVATVDQTGKVTAVANGLTKVIATAVGSSVLREDTAVVYVGQVPVNITVAPNGGAMAALGDTLPLAATVRDRLDYAIPAAMAPVTWATSQSAVADVERESGRVIARGQGNATITATSGAASKAVTVTVKQVVSTLSVQPPGRPVFVGDTVRLSARATDSRAATIPSPVMSWSSSDPQTATVDAAGLVRALKAGTVRIVAESEGKKDSVSLAITFTLARVIVTPDAMVLTALGDTSRARAEAVNPSGVAIAEIPVEWTSTAPAVATVDAAGLVTAVGNGAALVIAAAQGKADTVLVQVGQQVTTVELTPPGPATMTAIGDSLSLVAAVRDRKGSPVAGAAVAWSSTDPAVATVDAASGVVVARANGTTTIRATSAAAAGTITVTVRQAVSVVNVTPPTRAAYVGDTVRFAAQAADSRGVAITGVTLTWGTSDAALATVDANGLVNVLGAGTVTISAAADGKSGGAALAVTLVAVRFAATPDSARLTAFDETVQLAAAARNPNDRPIPGALVTWTSLAPTVASVSATGLVRAVGNGTAEVVASSGGAADTVVIRVEQIATGLSIAPNTATLNAIGDTLIPVVRVTDRNGATIAGAPVLWTTGDTTVTLTPAGLIIARTVGSATVRATSGLGTSTVAVTIRQVPQTLTLGLPTTSLALGDVVQLILVAADSNGVTIPHKSITWSSTNSAAATVTDSGLVRAIGPGTATLRAEKEGKSATVTVTVSIGAPGTRAWLGTVSTDWFNPSNWAPAAVPTASDVVTVAAQARQPVLSNNASVGSIKVAAGAAVNLSGRTLSVVQAVEADGVIDNGTVAPTGANTLLRGTISNLQLNGTGTVTTLTGPTRVLGVVTRVSGTTASLVLGGQRLRVESWFDMGGSSAVLVMTNPGDTLDVRGLVALDAGNHTGKLTAGTILVGGDFYFRGSAGSTAGGFAASGTHKVVFNGTGVQRVWNGTTDDTRGFQDLEATGSTTIVGGQNATCSASTPGTFVVRGTLRLTGSAALVSAVQPNCGILIPTTVVARGPISTVAGTTLSPGTLEVYGAGTLADVQGTFAPALTVFAGDNLAIRSSLAYQSIEFRGANPQPDGALTVAGGVSVTGALPITLTKPITAGGAVTVANGSSLVLGGQKLKAAGALTLAGTGTVSMTNAADTLDVGGAATFGTGTFAGKLTAGVLMVGGDLTLHAGIGDATGFAASGTHKVVLTGAGTQRLINPQNDDARAFQDLELGGSATVGAVNTSSCSVHTFLVRGALRVSGTANLAGVPHTSCGQSYGTGVVVKGPLSVAAGAKASNASLELYHASGTANVLGAYSTQTTIFATDNQTVRPGLGYQNVEFRGATPALDGTVAIAGTVTLSGSGDFALGGRRLNVTGGLTLANGRALVMTNAADTLDVRGNIAFGTTSEAGKLTAGVILAGGDLTFRPNVTDAGGFAPSGTHKVVFNGSGQQRIYNTSTDDTRAFQELELAGGATVGALTTSQCAITTFIVRGGLRLSGAATLGAVSHPACGQSYQSNAVVKGPLASAAGTTINPLSLELQHATGTANVLGTLSAPTVIFATDNQTVRAGLPYQNVEFRGASPAFDGPVTVSGTVTLGGNGDFALGGRKLRINGSLSMPATRTLVMNLPGDTLDVRGNITFGAASYAGKLTAGVILVGGDFTFRPNATDAGGFAASGTHKVVFNGGAVQRLWSTTVDASRAFQDVEVTSASKVGAGSACSTPGGVLVRGALAVAGAGSQLTNHPYTQCGGAVTTSLTVEGAFSTTAGTTVNVTTLELRHATGTANVKGDFAPTTTVFAGDNQTVAAGLGYQNLEFRGAAPVIAAAGVSAAGSLTFGGAGDFALGGRRLTVAGNLTVPATRTLVMTGAADTLDVRGSASFGAADYAGKLTGGVILVGGDFTFRPNAADVGGFAAAGTHKVVFNGSGIQRVWNTSVDADRTFQNVELSAAARVGSGSACSAVGGILVRGTLALTGTSQLTTHPYTQCGGNVTTTVRVDGALSSTSGTTVNNTSIELRDPSGTRDVAGTFAPATTIFAGDNQTVRSGLAYQNVEFRGLNPLFGTAVSVAGAVTVGGSGDFPLGGRKLRVDGGLTIPETRTLVMNSAADTLDVRGTLTFGAADYAGKLTAGVILVGGDFIFRPTTADAGGFGASGTHKVVLNGTGVQRVWNMSVDASRAFQDLEMAGAARVGTGSACSAVGGILVRGKLALSGTAQITNHAYTQCGGVVATSITVQGVLSSTASTSIAPSVIELRDASGTANVQGAFAPASAVFASSNQTIRGGLAYQAVELRGTSYTFDGTVATAGAMSLTGSGTFALGGRRLTVGGSLSFPNALALAMSSAADTLDVRGGLAFGTADETGKLTAGVMLLGGDLSFRPTLADAGGFAASGAHKVVFNGTGVQRVTNATADASRAFQSVEIIGAARVGVGMSCPVATAIMIRGTLSLAGSGQLTNHPYTQCGGSAATWVTVQGALTSTAGTAITPSQLELRDPTGTANVDGTFSPATTIFAGTNQIVKPGLGYQAIEFRGPPAPGSGAVTINGDLTLTSADPYTLSSDLTVTGSVNVNSSAVVTLNGHALHVGGNFNLGNSGASLAMASPNDTLDVRGSVTFGAADHTGKLSNGVLLVGGDLTFRPTLAEVGGFAASGAHKVVFNGAGVQRITNATADASRAFQNVELIGAARVGVGMSCPVASVIMVRGTLSLAGTSQLTNHPYTQCGGTAATWVVVQGALSSTGLTTVNNASLELRDPSGTANVQGSFSPGTTVFAGAGQTVKSGLAYQAVELRGENPVLAGPLTTTGPLTVANASDWVLTAPVSVAQGLSLNGSGAFRPSGRKVSVGGALTIGNTRTVEMLDGADTLDVRGAVSFGTADHTNKLVAGVMLLGGDLSFRPTLADAGGFAASGAHKVVFNGSGIQRVTNATAEPARAFQNVEIVGGSRVGIGMSCPVAAAIMVRGTLSLAGSGQITNHPYTQCGGTAATSLTVQGALSSAAGTVVAPSALELRDPSGTSNVQGSFTAPALVVAAPNVALKAGLSYGSVEMRGGYTFTTPLAMTGDLSVTNNGALVLNGQHVTVGGALALNGTSTVVMTNPADSLEVRGNLTFSAADHAGKLTAGALLVGGDLTFRPSETGPGGFAPSGTHTVVFNGGRTQTVYNASADETRTFQNWEVTAGTTAGAFSSTTCASPLVVKGELRLGGGAVLADVGGACRTTSLTLKGPLTTAAGTSVRPSTVQLEHASGTANVQGTFSPATAVFAGSNQPMGTRLTYQNVQITGSAVLTGAGNATVVNGNLTNSGLLTVGAGASLDVVSTLTLTPVSVTQNAGTIYYGTLTQQSGASVTGAGVMLNRLDRLVFGSSRAGNEEIYSMHADGSNQLRLTTDGASDVEPSWSPDRRQVVFASNRSGSYQLYVMNADGTGVNRLTTSGGNDRRPRWSPGGTQVVFQSDRDGNSNVYLINVNGTGSTRLSNHPGVDAQPSWSSNGAQIVFVSDRGQSGNEDIYVMNTDGSSVVRLTTDPGADREPAWSPDNTKIAFVSNRDDASGEVYTMTTAGASQTRITTSAGTDMTPTWSTTSARIAFSSNRSGPFQIWAVNVNGTSPTNLTNSAGGDTAPFWK